MSYGVPGTIKTSVFSIPVMMLIIYQSAPAADWLTFAAI
jgi:hypothetical protein